LLFNGGFKLEEPPLTASAMITFSEKLEDETSDFYRSLIEKFGRNEEIFQSFIKDSKRDKTLLIRTYQETISDALEACFSFEGLKIRDYRIDTKLGNNINHSDSLKKAIYLEEVASKFYSDVAEKSDSLLATIPRVLKKIADRRKKRIQKIKLLKPL
jgi:predicted transcriptional regulator